jgi:D-alanyl-D-alanine carboxypeptidase
VPPLFEPGTGWNYSNTNYIYLGLLIEDVTGMPVANVLRTRIIQPLGLDDTYLAGAEQGPPVIRAPYESATTSSHTTTRTLRS